MGRDDAEPRREPTADQAAWQLSVAAGYASRTNGPTARKLAKLRDRHAETVPPAVEAWAEVQALLEAGGVREHFEHWSHSRSWSAGRWPCAERLAMEARGRRLMRAGPVVDPGGWPDGFKPGDLPFSA